MSIEQKCVGRICERGPSQVRAGGNILLIACEGVFLLGHGVPSYDTVASIHDLEWAIKLKGESMKVLTLFLAFVFLSPVLNAGERIPWETIHNHYRILLPHGDRATVDLEHDGSMVLMPSSTNNDYTHICWAKWKFDEETQILSIKKATLCELMNGEFKVERTNKGFVLRDGGKRLTLQFIYDRRK